MANFQDLRSLGGNFSPPPGRFGSSSSPHACYRRVRAGSSNFHLSPPSRLVFSRLPSGQEEMQQNENSLLHFSSSPHHLLRRVRAVSSNVHLSPPSGLVFSRLVHFAPQVAASSAASQVVATLHALCRTMVYVRYLHLQIVLNSSENRRRSLVVAGRGFATGTNSECM